MATFVQDSFTEAAETELSLHTGEAGATWTAHPSDSSAAGAGVSDTDGGANTLNRVRLLSGGDGVGLYYASGLPASADYDVVAEFVSIQASSGASVRACGRMSTTQTTFYFIGYNETTDVWELGKYVSGTLTVLDSFAQALVVDQLYTAKLEMRGDQLKGYIDGVEQLSATDSDITAAGRVGLRTSSSFVLLDSIEASDPEVAPPSPMRFVGPRVIGGR